MQLRQALHEFKGGRIVITVGGIPYRCPPAPLEFTFLLEDWLHKQGLRQHTEMHYLFPLSRVFTSESVAEVVTPMLEERNIHYTVFFNAEAAAKCQNDGRKLAAEEFFRPNEGLLCTSYMSIVFARQFLHHRPKKGR